MPVKPSIPGVYIEEIPIARTITGISTWVVSFIGRTLKGTDQKT